MKALRIVWALALRSLQRTARRPQTLMPLLLVPVMFLAVTSGGAARSTDLPGFPAVDSFFHFALAGSIVQAAMLGGLSVGIAVALDVENGFFDRLVATPVARWTLVAGRLLAGAIVGVGQALLFLVVGIAFGAPVAGGSAGAAIVCLLAALTAVGAGSLSIALALKTRSVSVVQGTFPLVFVGIFLSSTFFPRPLLTGPARTVADYNPLSYMVEGMRDPIISQLTWHEAWAALASGLGLAVVTVGISIWALRVRVGTA